MNLVKFYTLTLDEIKYYIRSTVFYYILSTFLYLKFEYVIRLIIQYFVSSCLIQDDFCKILYSHVLVCFLLRSFDIYLFKL